MQVLLWSLHVPPFVAIHSNAAASLANLLTAIQNANITNPAVEVKQQISNRADYVRGSKTLWVFNITNNNYRLIGEISLGENGIYEFTAVWIGTHKEYDKKFA